MSPDRRTEVEVEGRRLHVSNLDKIYFPDVGFTKGQLIDYYVRVAPVMLPHVRDRPLTLRRFAEGVDGPSFYEKHVPKHAPRWVRTVRVPAQSTRTASGEVEYALVCDLPTLVWAANLASIELHVPLWHVGRRRSLPAPPDYLVFDLDPGDGTTVVECCRVAGWIREALEPKGLVPYPKTSGSRGLHLLAPLVKRTTWDRTRAIAHDLARALEREHPELVVSNMRRDLRRKKVLIDWSQNHSAKTTVAAYSVRARPTPTVSTPVTWDEVSTCARKADPHLLDFTTDAVLDRVDRLGDLVVPPA